MSIQQAFNSFMEKDFQSAVDSSTKASWNGSGYSVELFDDGTYRVLWDNQIGNLYKSSGIILSVPPLGDDEWHKKPKIRFYDNAERTIRDSFEEHWQAVLANQ